MPSRTGLRRLRIDPRLAIGVALTAASVGGVWAVVGHATRGDTVYAAKHTIVAGDPVTPGDLVPVRVRMSDTTDRYVTPERLPASGAEASGTVLAGELVPRSAVTTTPSGEHGRVVLAVAGPLASAIKPGRIVAVWSIAPEDAGRHGQPYVVTDHAVVVAVTSREGIVTSDTVSVEVQVDADDIGAVLAAAADDDLSLVADAARGL